jgi:hypothetical protein
MQALTVTPDVIHSGPACSIWATTSLLAASTPTALTMRRQRPYWRRRTGTGSVGS